MQVNRRQLIQMTLAAGAAGPFVRPAAAEQLGRVSVDTLPTPALLLDADRLEANLKKLAAHCRESDCGFRPHANTHKCPELARRQLKSGAVGVCVATVPEAKAMVRAGIPGVLLTSPIVENSKVAAVTELAKAGGDIMLAVGDPRQADMLAEAAAASQIVLDVLVDVDVNDRRTGALPGAPALKELQAGSYAFMDVGYMRIGSRSGNEVYDDFQPSLTVLTTVVSATHPDLVTVDAGGKSMAASPAPLVKGQPGLMYRRFGDEFGAITAEGGRLPKLGDRIELIVPHCDPTVNLYGHLVLVRAGNVEAVWGIEGRHGAS